MLNEEERDRGLEEANETAALDRARPLSLRDMLEKEGCRPREKLRTERLDVMTSVDGMKGDVLQYVTPVCSVLLMNVYHQKLNNILVQ